MSNPIYDSKKYLNSNGFCNTADIVLLSVIDDELGVLLIKRKEWPFENDWALPGGFVDGDKDFDAEATAKRELQEETGLKNIYLEQLYTFTAKGRDPREETANSPVRIWSVAYMALIDYEKVTAVASSDASDAKWFKISQLPKLGFDHDKVIQKAVERVRNKINYTNVGFELVPKTFTIPELQTIFENVLGEKLDRNNFRTKILKLEILKLTGQIKKEGRGQPAPYYSLNKKKLASLKGRSLF